MRKNCDTCKYNTTNLENTRCLSCYSNNNLYLPNWEPNEPDLVHHPNHYIALNGMEAKDVIEAFTEHLNGAEATHTANVLKYMLRWKKKDGLRDLKKAKQYIDFLIEYLENKEEKENN